MKLIEIKFDTGEVFKPSKLTKKTTCDGCDLTQEQCIALGRCNDIDGWVEATLEYCIWTNHSAWFTTSCGHRIVNNPQGNYCHKCSKTIKIRGAE